MKIDKKYFYRYCSSKRKIKENAGQVLKGERDLVTLDIEKSEVLTTFFMSDFPR